MITSSRIRNSNLLKILPGCLLGVFTSIALTTPLTSYAKPQQDGFAGGPRTIASKERVTVLIDREVEAEKTFLVLKISVPADSKINAFLLPDPPRLVVDFEGASIKKSENFQVPDNKVIQQIRLGAHPEKLRVVIDFMDAKLPEYDWKAGKRQAIIRVLESSHAASIPPTQEQRAPTVAPIPTLSAPTVTPSVAATSAAPAVAASATPAPSATPSLTPTVTPTVAQPTQAAAASDVPTGAAPKPALPQGDVGMDQTLDVEPPSLGDLEAETPAPKVPTTFSITGYKFERLPDKTPVLKILLNKPRAQTQISKVDKETYSIQIRDCGLENEDLELPQFPPHDFVGFVMVVAETVGKNVEISVSTEEGMVLATSMHDQEIWVKEPQPGN